jgi:hypothetical protein
MVPRRQDLLAVVGGERRGGGVVEGGGLGPVVGLLIELAQVGRRVLSVCCWIKGLVEALEGVRVVEQTDLHTADVDIVCRGGPDELNRLRLGGEELTLPIRIDCPGPWNEGPRVRVATAAFDACDGGEQTRRDGVGLLCGHDGLAAGGGERWEREGGVRGQRRYKAEQKRKGGQKPHWGIVG